MYYEHRTLTADSLRKCCIKHEWCTMCTNDGYWDMFKLITDEALHYREITTDVLEDLASMILAFSDEESTANHSKVWVMSELVKWCRVVFYPMP